MWNIVSIEMHTHCLALLGTPMQRVRLTWVLLRKCQAPKPAAIRCASPELHCHNALPPSAWRHQDLRCRAGTALHIDFMSPMLTTGAPDGQCSHQDLNACDTHVWDHMC
jgi:hypothetical protein